MKRIVLFGAHGQVGQELVKALAPLGELTALGRQQVDLADLDAIAACLNQHQPQIIVNAAAYTAVDKAESEPELAHQINAAAPGQMAKFAADSGARLIHLSTDYVFAGQQGMPHRETDKPQPLGAYGRSKLAGEEAIQAAAPQHVILRTAWVYGAQGKSNFVKAMLRLGREREFLRVVQDQVGSPTWARDIASAIAALMPHQPTGIYHYTSSGVASWYDFAIAIFEEAQALGMTFAQPQVEPITTADYPTPAQRPAYSVLDCQKLTQLLGQPAPHWRYSLRTMLKELHLGSAQLQS